MRNIARLGILLSLYASGCMLGTRNARSRTVYEVDDGVHPVSRKSLTHESSGNAYGVGMPMDPMMGGGYGYYPGYGYGGYGMGGYPRFGGDALCRLHPDYCAQVYSVPVSTTTVVTCTDCEARLDRIERKIEVLAQNDRDLEYGFRLMVQYLRKYKMTLDQVVDQNRLTCKRFMKNPKVIKNKKDRQDQIAFCKALEVAADDANQAQNQEGTDE